MQNKGTFEKTSPQPSLPPRLNLTPDFSTSFLPVARGHREWGLQSIYHKVYLLPPQKRFISFLLFPFSSVGSSRGCRWIFAPAMDLHEQQGHSHSLHHRLQRNLCSGTWNTSSPLLHWPWCLQRCSSPIFSLLSGQNLLLGGKLSPSLNALLQQSCTITNGLSLISSNSILELTGIGSIGYGESF